MGMGADEMWNVANLLGRLEAISVDTGKKVDNLVALVEKHDVRLYTTESDIKSLKGSLETIRSGLADIAVKLDGIQTTEAKLAAQRRAHGQWLRAIVPLWKYGLAGGAGFLAEMIRRWVGGG